MRIICWLKGLYYSFKGFLIGNDIEVEGHLYEELETHDNVTVNISRCRDCGKIDISWTK